MLKQLEIIDLELLEKRYRKILKKKTILQALLIPGSLYTKLVKNKKGGVNYYDYLKIKGGKDKYLGKHGKHNYNFKLQSQIKEKLKQIRYLEKLYVLIRSKEQELKDLFLQFSNLISSLENEESDETEF
ncbi:MAG: hypothetical protein ACTSRR_09745 [Candidatus Heimdallarchaeaceae archaeon]